MLTSLSDVFQCLMLYVTAFPISSAFTDEDESQRVLKLLFSLSSYSPLNRLSNNDNESFKDSKVHHSVTEER